MRGGPDRARRELGLDALPTRGEARRVEEARLVQPLGHRRDVLLGDRPLVARRYDVADLGEGVLAIEEGDDVEQRDGQDRDLIGEAGRVP